MNALRSFRRGRGRRYWTVGATLVVAAVFGIVFVASSGASLSTSPFEGSDGNMIVDTSGNTDWCTDFPAPTTGQTCAAPITGLRTLTDVQSGTSDNSFTGGSHEDDPNVTIAAGSVPPNKNDLTRAYAATETISNETFLYLAWERQPNPNGSANIDFELDQNSSPGDFTQPGNLTINRTEGDILITYDFAGSGTPDLGLLTWLTAGNGHVNGDCEASGQKLPCWGNRIDLNPNSTPPAEAGVNTTGTIDEVIAGGQLDAGSFGEAKIDLSAIPGLFTPDTCKAFGNMFVKSRSSGSSIDAELKDFIAPAPVQVTNCPTPDIATQTSVSSMTVGDTQTVGDTATLTNGKNPTGDVTFTLYSDPDCQDATAVTGSATLNGSGVATFAGASFTPTQTGTYYWGATYPGDDQNNAASACGGDNEEIVVNPASPNVTTTADPASAVIGSADLTSASDTATFTDGFQLDGRDATFTLYSDSSCDPADATSVTGTATISGGSATFTGDASGLAVGTYYWGVSLPADTNNDAVSECGGDEGVHNEVLSIEKASPQVTTVADPSSAVAGPDASSVSDTATFTDGFQLDGRDATFTLYGDQFCNPLDATSVTGTATISGGSATFTGDASALPAGTYYWGVSLAADAGNNAVSECGGDEGVENEVLSIEKASPQVTTVADPSAAGVGSDASSVSDTATFTDGFQLDGRDAAFTLYSDPSCDPADATSVAGSATISDGSATFTGDASALSAGTYYWGVSLPADDNNNAVSECGGDEGVENEMLSIGQASPTIATTLSESAGSHGDKVHDSAKLSGATGHAGGTVTYSVYSDSSCTTKVADGGTVTVTNGSVPNSNDVTFNTPGTYYWQASYSGDTNNQSALSTCTDEKLVIAPLIDLAVTKVGSPNPITIGKGDITWTMVVTNNGPDTATGVKIADPLPAGTTFVSVSPSKGSCTGGAIISCSLGTMAAGETVTITLVTTPTVEGTVSNTVTVVGNEQETNTANNTATASVVVNGFTPPPVFCVAVSKVTPSQLFVGRKTKLTIHVTQHGKAVKGIRVLIKGPKLNMRTGASNANGVITTRVKLKKSGIAVFSPIASKRCNTKRVGITGVFTPPVTG